MQTSDPSHTQHPSHNEQLSNNQDPVTEVAFSSAASDESDESLNIETLNDLASLADYSLLNTLDADPDAKADGGNHSPRQVFSGHYVPVTPMQIENPEYVTHSKTFFRELGFADNMAQSADFMSMFSGDLSNLPHPMRKVGWSTGYALSIYGNEYTQQCPFKTGNGYGDGRAASVLEAVIKGQRWEMQLKGSGRTPYSRGADGRAVLRSSVREFLAQEQMHALGVPTSRSLSLYASKTETVKRPWYSEGSRQKDPDIMVSDAVAISTRVAPSFIRVGQLELFGRRARGNEHLQAMAELEKIVLHLIDREYADVIDPHLTLDDKVVLLAREFRSRLTSLIANWIRVGYCQGNFNSDNCAAGGFILDYGPYGFCELFDPRFQPWTGGGEHYSFLNQPVAAEKNFGSFCTALKPLLASNPEVLQQLEEIEEGFAIEMQTEMQKMWAVKLGLGSFDSALFKEIFLLMIQTSVDYTIFFRELSEIPDNIDPLKRSFYSNSNSKELDERWSAWLTKWKTLINGDSSSQSNEELSRQMKRVNPKYILREWFVVPAYKNAAVGNYDLIRELQDIMTQPYAEQSKEIEDKYYRLKPPQFFEAGGTSHYSCSS
ncbi:protein adenylyltransferase SelO family protein [Cocleimonas sp. KMM 6892]|uniref:protein adenylyltransferase SelO n=1 Tax=unclassified Cocleimonas TaxID=2639732 RepID=UPI002DB9707D|nr:MULTISPECIES: protein adenylyltransferase SelO family protein [unclassified Cocleimonas]MEB8434284.1 protein adenylyltransferase SelO family protein [Cocleimonas sp. KMM 6892]MEC4717097.1 protein adenylyltransferase SelO family protein [Cocleimonas sp. KMM 6895]MEC4746556.1 protein adenylyltransferase SelO family protein [Cocleimonas sp. KMM 6896]